eukprot:471624_1
MKEIMLLLLINVLKCFVILNLFIYCSYSNNLDAFQNHIITFNNTFIAILDINQSICIPVSNISHYNLNDTNMSSVLSTTCCVICAMNLMNSTTNMMNARTTYASRIRSRPILCPQNLTCGHQKLFHEECLQLWLNIKSECPMCRQQSANPLCSLPRTISNARARAIDRRVRGSVRPVHPMELYDESECNPAPFIIVFCALVFVVIMTVSLISKD